MGIFGSKPSKPIQKAENGKAASKTAEKDDSGIVVKCCNFDKADYKILILGPGECGKSTYWRQLRNVYTGGLTPREKKLLIPAIRVNIFNDIKIILTQAEELCIDISSSLENEIDTLKNNDFAEDDLSEELADAIAAVWDDPGAKLVYEQIHSCYLSDHSGYFLDSVKRIAQADYIPTNEDVIKTRIRTTGVNQIHFDINGKKILLVDVGGQLCERGKWKNAFSNVSAIIFIVSLADFDQTMFEVMGEMRTKDSIELFKNTVSKELFLNTPVYLVFNKEDEMKRKLAAYPNEFKKAYPEFTGNVEDENECIKYIQELYISQVEGRKEEAAIKPFVTCAVDQERLKKTFLDIAGNVLQIKK